MMPSRGLPSLARGHTAPRLFQLQCRHLSSSSSSSCATSSFSSRLPARIPRQHQPLAASWPSRQWRTLRSPLAVPAVASVRHASTTTEATTAATSSTSPSVSDAPPAPPAGTEQTAFPNLDTITLDNIDLSNATEAVPETIGYLHSIGINYGWGPTSALQWILEHIHVYTGIPWWGSIAVTAIVLRLVTLPLYVQAADANARQAALVTVMRPMSEKISERQRAGDAEGAQAAMAQLFAARRKAGITFRRQFAPVAAQGVIGFCGFKLVRAMAALPVPGFKDGGFLWLSDLTVSDPYGIMPVLMGASIHLLMRLGGESGSQDMGSLSPGMKTFMFYGMPGVVMMIMGWQPGALCVWFAASGAIGMSQALLLQRPAVRKFLGIAPIYKPTAAEGHSNPFSTIMESMRPAAPAKKTTSGARPAASVSAHWQAPNLHTRPAHSSPRGRIIDVKATSKTGGSTSGGGSGSDDMISPAKPTAAAGGSGGISSMVQGLKDRWNEAKTVAQERARQQLAEKEKAAKRQEAEAYEKRARERKQR